MHVLDPSPILKELAASGEPAYLRTDSHWTPNAVDLVAKAVAERLETIVDLPPADREWTRTRLERRGRGDLWRLLRLPTTHPQFAEEATTVEEVTAWDGQLWAPVRQAPVLLMGDSFATVYSDRGLFWGRAAGLAEQLAYYLRRDVDCLARAGGGSDVVRRELARQPERLSSKKVLVYQFACRKISAGDWPLVEIP
jgi:alginate O-acetyltransferase complex protein AlgJ